MGDRQDEIHFITSLSGNTRLNGTARHWVEGAIADNKAHGENVRIFHSFMYKADSWKYQQRVVVKKEVNEQGTNVRYVVTDFKEQKSSFIYSYCYCDRGRMELMTNELKNGLQADRISCNKFTANQFRLFIHCAEYVLSLRYISPCGGRMHSPSVLPSASPTLTRAGRLMPTRPAFLRKRGE